MTRTAMALALSAALLASGCGSEPSAPPSRPAQTEDGAQAERSSASPPELIAAADLKLVPVSTFEMDCARCHGPGGSFYGEAFAGLKGKHEQLRTVVADMMRGPAFLEPTDVEVDAMAAYHRALAAGEPFAVVTAVGPGRIAGEATPGAMVTVQLAGVETGERSAPADDAGAWSIPLPTGATPAGLTVTHGKTSAHLPAHSSWTHPAP